MRPSTEQMQAETRELLQIEGLEARAQEMFEARYPFHDDGWTGLLHEAFELGHRHDLFWAWHFLRAARRELDA